MRFFCATAALTIGSVYATSETRDLPRGDTLGVHGSYIPSKSPRDNIFAGISEAEKDAIELFLIQQTNVTLPEDIWFYHSYPWLLAPNKSEAISYLDDGGPKPPRYARVMASDPCFEREYMVGPLPIGNSTKVKLLEYVNNGNATLESGDCDENVESSSRRKPRTARASRQKAEASGSRVGSRNRLQRRSPHSPYEEVMAWNGEELPHDDQAPPMTILPDGARHEFDPEQNYVSWMHFTFFVSTGPGGVSLHDIRYKGERIIYELAMQEALAHYAGPDEIQTYASYLDVTIGFTDFNLIPGYDCPSYATYTDAFCLFEYPKDYPMNRHQHRSYYHATKNIAFLVRSVSTVDNYDYQTTYEFYLDGSIQVLVRASGYIQGSTNVNATNAWDYGFHIRKDLSGSMHDHVLNFKADLDILGTRNTVFKTEFVPHSQVYDWSDGKVINTMKVEKSFITNEDDGKIMWSPNAAAAYSVVNKDKRNELGECPGFRIYPSTGSATHLTIRDSTVFGKLVDWASHHLYVLRRKDSEPVSAHPGAITWTKEPRSWIDFNGFFDNESLEQEDIVLYFNLGMHHMPDSYDLPNTVFQGAQSGITFRPQNYQRSDSSLSSRHQIHIMSKEGEVDLETYGAKEISGTYDLAASKPPFYPLPEYEEGEF